MLGIVIFPESVMNAVEPDLHELEIIPFLSRHQVADDLEMLAAHFVDLVPKPLLVVGSKAFHIDRIIADQGLDFGFDTRRPGVDVRVRVGRQETAYVYAVDMTRRITGRDAHHHGTKAFL